VGNADNVVWSWDGGDASTVPEGGDGFPQQAPEQNPELLERFELFELLGQGSAGSVYRAHDRKQDRVVALKLLNAPTPRARARLLGREGALTAALRHPGIVRIHAAGELGGVAFLAYEFVEGCHPLRAEPGQAGREAFVNQVLAALEAVSEAHRQGIVHRDLKPDNLLVDASGRLRVADFGLAWGKGSARLTQTGAMIGTPSYMAPEAFTGDQHQAQVDVYSMGMVLYEGLTGRRAFAGETLFALAEAIGKGEISSPSEIDPTIPAAFDRVCLTALSKDPAGRYADAGVMGKALVEARADPTLAADSEEPMAPADETSTRSVLMVLVVAIVALATAVLALALR
jgi:serine/threonine protein kinase